jgi:hypothetical protein
VDKPNQGVKKMWELQTWMVMQEHRQHIKQASAEAEDNWMSQHTF